MKEKNRFSTLLKHLMTVTKLKNYTLAKELQYDESYISKWANGSLLPTEKNSEKILREISRCLVASMDAESRAVLYSEFQVENDADLERRIFSSLEAEFNYVADLKESTGTDTAPKTAFYPELTLSQFTQRIRYPALQQAKSLDFIFSADILSLDWHYQLSMAELESSQNVDTTNRSYPNTHFSMLVNLDAASENNTHNVEFLLNFLTSFSNADMQFYTCPQMVGKVIMVAKDLYCISGMVIDDSHLLGVTATEDPKHCNAIYYRLHSLCNQQTLAVRRTIMSDMLLSNEYMEYLFSRRQRWILGHFTEHFLPDDLYELLATEYCQSHLEVDRADLTRIHKLNKSVLETMDLQILIHEKTITDFAVTGVIDFYNYKMQLTPSQRLAYLSNSIELCKKNPKLSIRLTRNGTVSDLQHIPHSTLFLSESFCYMRLVRNGLTNTLSVLNKVQLCNMFRKFYDDIWDNEEYVHPDRQCVQDLMQYALQLVNVQLQVK